MVDNRHYTSAPPRGRFRTGLTGARVRCHAPAVKPRDEPAVWRPRRRPARTPAATIAPEIRSAVAGRHRHGSVIDSLTSTRCSSSARRSCSPAAESPRDGELDSAGGERGGGEPARGVEIDAELALAEQARAARPRARPGPSAARLRRPGCLRRRQHLPRPSPTTGAVCRSKSCPPRPRNCKSSSRSVTPYPCIGPTSTTSPWRSCVGSETRNAPSAWVSARGEARPAALEAQPAARLADRTDVGGGAYRDDGREGRGERAGQDLARPCGGSSTGDSRGL